jgi:hypothetical protein
VQKLRLSFSQNEPKRFLRQMTKYLSALLTSLFLSSILSDAIFAQEFEQELRGKIVEETSLHPIEEAEVLAFPTEEKGFAWKAGITDSEGSFEISDLPAGRYSIRVRKAGYIELVISDYLIQTGKAPYLEAELSPDVYEGEEVVITNRNERDFNRPSIHLIKVEESKRYAAVFFDPARVAASFPGVVQTDNQSNNLVIRGNSPNGMLWRLEGVDVANPNHLPNAGTFSDRVSLSGGGQIILSTQLLANSTFSKSAFAPQYGDALSGVFDMRLRKGNPLEHEFSLQAGLIGVDLSAEGPISKKQGSSYLANYRYSFTGLLAAMGATFGGEDIRFQDFSFNLTFPTEKAGTFTVFGVGGLSSNVFTGARSDTAIESGKDRYDIDFRSRMAAMGMTHQIVLGTKSSLRSVLAISGIKSDRVGSLITDFEADPLEVERDEIEQNYLSFSSTFQHLFNRRTSIKAGVYFTQQQTEMLSNYRPLTDTSSLITLAQNQGRTQLIQPFANISYTPVNWLTADIGLHAQYLTLNGSFALEPRLNLQMTLNPKHQLTFAYGLHSQQQVPQVYFAAVNRGGETIFPNRDLGFTQAHHLVLAYQYKFNENSSLRIEPYYQSLFNVPVIPDVNVPFSTLNLIEGFVTDSLVNEGQGRNYGLDIFFEKYLTKNFYVLASGSLFESKYTDYEGIERDTRFNGNYAYSLSTGYEKERQTKKGKNKTFGANLRIVGTGGFLLQPVDTLASIELQRTVFDVEEGYTERLDDLFRIDVRFIFRRNLEKRTRTFSIDIQNLTNNQPVAFRVFDLAEQQIVERRRFGLTPLLSYRVEF